MVICLERGVDLHMVQLMPLPLIVSCFSKIEIGFAFLAHLTRVVPVPLNGCCCCCITIAVMSVMQYCPALIFCVSDGCVFVALTGNDRLCHCGNGCVESWNCR